MAAAQKDTKTGATFVVSRLREFGWNYASDTLKDGKYTFTFEAVNNRKVKLVVDFGPSLCDVGTHVAYSIMVDGMYVFHGMVEKADALPHTYSNVAELSWREK